MWEETIETPTYCQKTMERLIKRDNYLKWCYNDLKQRNPNCSNRELCRILFNANVVEDGGMIEAYLECNY